MTTILVTVPIDHMPDVVATLETVGEIHYLVHPTREELIQQISNVDVIFTNTFNKIDQEVIDVAPNLKLVATPSTGTDHLDLAALSQSGIKVQSLTKDLDVLENIPSTAELAVTLMLVLLRNMRGATRAVINGKWDYVPFRGREVQDLTVGVLGYGRLGKIFCRLISGFKPRILVCDPNVKVNGEHLYQVDYDELLRESEVISIHVHLREDTRHMFNKDIFMRMKKKPYLINTSRGGLINSEDLVWALENNYITAAGLDVIEGEVDFQTKKNILIEYARTHDNLVITPHMGGMTYEAQNKAFGHAAQKVRDFFIN